MTKYSNRTPPYIIATPSLRYVDLQPFRACKPVLLLFTDGVDNLVSGRFLFQPFEVEVPGSAMQGRSELSSGRLKYWATCWGYRYSKTFDDHGPDYIIQWRRCHILYRQRLDSHLRYLQIHNIVLIYFNEM